LKLSRVKNLGETFLLEDKDEPVIYKTQKVVNGVLDGFKKLQKQLQSNMVNREWQKIQSNVDNMNGQKRDHMVKDAVVMFANEQAANVDFKSVYKTWIEQTITKLENWGTDKYEPIMRKDLFLPLKVASHYTAYTAINGILEDIISKSGGQDGHDDVLAAAMTFVANAKAEAKFGNTTLPLWIVYGSEGGVEYLGQKDDYIAKTSTELIDSSPAKALDQPYLVIRIQKAKKSASTFDLDGHNVTEMYLMSGIDLEKQEPKYLVLNITTVSGSTFSMKAEVEKEITKKWR
jgi:hypothetical protein